MSFFTRSHSERLTLSIFTLLAILGTLIINGLSNAYPPKGLNIGEISREIFGDVLITPASYAFAIWGVIYIGLIVYGVYQLQSSCRRDAIIQSLNSKLIAACLFQIIWVGLFTYQLFSWSVLAIAGILIALILAYQTLGYEKQVKRGQISSTRYWRVHVPFSIYLGWISLATILNMGCALSYRNWSGWGISPLVWTAGLLVVVLGIGILAIWQRQDYALAGVLIWANVAIAVRHFQSEPVLFGLSSAIAIGLGGCILWKQNSLRARTQGF